MHDNTWAAIAVTNNWSTNLCVRWCGVSIVSWFRAITLLLLHTLQPEHSGLEMESG